MFTIQKSLTEEEKTRGKGKEERVVEPNRS